MGTITSSPLPKYFYENGRLFTTTPDGRAFEQGSIGLLRSNIVTVLPSSKITLKEKIDEEKDLLIQNTTHFLTIQYLFEKSYEQPAQPSNYLLYTQMLEKAKIQATRSFTTMDQTGLSEKEKKARLSGITENALKQIFFDKIAEIQAKKIQALKAKKIDDSERPLASFYSKVVANAHIFSVKANGWLSDFKAGVIYYIFNRVIQYYVKLSIYTHIRMLTDYKQKISNDEIKKEDFKNELINNLNGCLTILNGAYTTITKKAPTGAIPVMVAKELTREEANQGRSSEILYKQFATTLIVSTLGKHRGSIASWAIQKFISPGIIVESLIQTIAGSAKDNKGYSHAINSLILDQLNQIKKLLNEKPGPTNIATPISKERQRQLSTIIQQLLELLHKSECSTVDELRTVVNRTKKHSDLETNYIPLLMETLALQVSELLESHVNENRIDELTLQVLKLTNDSFMPMKIVTEKEMNETEKKVKTTRDEVLDMFIDKTIREKIKLGQRHFLWLTKKLITRTVFDIPAAKKAIGEITDGLVRIATERSTYLCALSHLLLIPHVEAMKKP